MSKRIVGIDIARALAVIGMIIVNFKIVFGDQGPGWLKIIADFFSGKAAATFVVLAGVGLALMTNSAIRQKDKAKLKIATSRILKRALFLFVVGLSYIWIWPADILHFYGIYMLLLLLFISQKQTYIWIGTIVLIGSYPVLMYLFDYSTGWNFETLDYPTFWSLDGFFRNLFFNGFHPVFPWAAFMLFGLWLGRQDLRDRHFLKRLTKTSLVVFFAIQVGSYFLGKLDPSDDWQAVVGTSPMPPLPLYMLNGISFSTFLIAICILWAQGREEHSMVKALHKTGQLALTFYVAHVVVGMGLIEFLLDQPLGTYSITFSVLYALSFSLLCIVFAHFWLKHKKAGPLEWIMRKITD